MHKYFSTGQYKNIIKKVHERCNYHGIPIPELTFKGTIKLHGTNSSIYNMLREEKIVVQSRNNEISVENDNNGFAKFVENNKESFDSILNVIKKNYPQEINDQTAVIYGEWVGGNIQPAENLGVRKLEKMFVIFAMKFIKNGQNFDDVLESDSKEQTTVERWFSEQEIKSVLNQVDNLSEKRIYNIYDFPTFEVKIDMANPKLTQNILIDITNSVEKECPFAKQFGQIGVGEGVVWKCISSSDKLNTSDLVFKVKGQQHSVSKVTTIAEVDTVKVNSINEFVNIVLTENRLKQGIEYLQEQQLPLLVNSMGPFLKWIVNDCLKEEADVLIESGLEKKEVSPNISNKAKQWFLQRINSQLIEPTPVKMKM